MPAKKPFVNIKHLPDDLFSCQDERFYDFVDKFIGKKKQTGLLKLEDISSADIYLNCSNVLGVLKLDSAALLPLKESLCLKLDDDSFVILPGVKSPFSYPTELLTKKKMIWHERFDKERISLLLLLCLQSPTSISITQHRYPTLLLRRLSPYLHNPTSNNPIL